jgi:hypothetical protein
MFSPVLLLLGLTLGLMAMWAVASPVGATGDLITGGWTTCWVGSERFACDSSACSTETCRGEGLDPCEDFSGEHACYGGYINVASCSGIGTPYAYPVGTQPCVGQTCLTVHSATCY